MRGWRNKVNRHRCNNVQAVLAHSSRTRVDFFPRRLAHTHVLQVHPTGLVAPDDPDATVKFLAAGASLSKLKAGANLKPPTSVQACTEPLVLIHVRVSVGSRTCTKFDGTYMLNCIETRTEL